VTQENFAGVTDQAVIPSYQPGSSNERKQKRSTINFDVD